MRKEPTLRIPLGMLGLLAVLAVYCLLIAGFVAPLIENWNGLVQAPIYLALGVVWLLPLKRFLIWMETGRWRAGE